MVATPLVDGPVAPLPVRPATGAHVQPMVTDFSKVPSQLLVAAALLTVTALYLFVLVYGSAAVRRRSASGRHAR